MRDKDSQKFTMFSKQEFMESELKELTDNLDVHLQFISLQAKLTKAKYDALKAEGFSDKEALDLCWRN